MTDQSKTYVTGVCEWNYDMRNAPTGKRCLLLNAGGVAIIGVAPGRGDTFFKAWAPLPKRDKEVEQKLGVSI